MARPRANPAEVLRRTRQDALRASGQVGVKRLRRLLREAQRDLDVRLQRATGLSGPGTDSFTAEQLQLTLRQVRDVTKMLDRGMVGVVREEGGKAAEREAQNLLRYMERAERKYVGIASRLPLKEAMMVDRVARRTDASILRRLTGKEKDAWPVKTAADRRKKKEGIMKRYGRRVIAKFEDQLQLGLATRKPWAEIRSSLVKQSPFLQQAPASWAERIVRTELMAGSNRAAFESTRAADDTLGDMVKILSATFDDRTAADSYAVHGQIRRPDEAFETWYGMMQHPPARPNDREIVVPHRIVWPIPGSLEPVSDGEVASAWANEGRKEAMPSRPLMETVARDRFGKK